MEGVLVLGGGARAPSEHCQGALEHAIKPAVERQPQIARYELNYNSELAYALCPRWRLCCISLSWKQKPPSCLQSATCGSHW